MKNDIIIAEVEGEGMMIDVEKGTSYFLNETALLILKMLQDGKNIDDIKQVLLGEYAVEATEAETDIREFIAKLQKKGMLWEQKSI